MSPRLHASAHMSAWTSSVNGLRRLETIVRTCALNTHAFATGVAAERMSIAQGLWALRWAHSESCMKRGNVSTTADQSMSVNARYWIHTSHPNVMSAGIVHEAGSGTPGLTIRGTVRSPCCCPHDRKQVPRLSRPVFLCRSYSADACGARLRAGLSYAARGWLLGMDDVVFVMGSGWS